jgi:hypothetical protein
MSEALSMIHDTLGVLSGKKQSATEDKVESSFYNMEKQECLKYFSGNYNLMLRTLYALNLYICRDGIIRKAGED